MSRSRLLLLSRGLPALLVLVALPAAAQTFMVQCRTSTLLHPNAPTSASGEPPTPVRQPPLSSGACRTSATAAR